MMVATFRALVWLWAAAMAGLSIAWFFLPGQVIDPTAGILVSAVCMVAVGALLTVRRPSNLVGPLALVAGSSWVVYLFGNGYGLASLASPDGLPGGYLFAWLGGWVGAVFPLGLAALVLVFPTGRAFGWWRLVWLPIAAGAAFTAWGAVRLWGLPLESMVDFELIDQTTEYQAVDIGFVIGFAVVLPATLSVLARYRAADGVERQQIKWLAAATGLFAVMFAVQALIVESDAIWWAVAASLTAIPIAIGVAVLRYRLYEIDRIVSRTVSYALVVGLLAGVFFAVVTGLTSVLSAESDLAVAASTLAVAALFNPVRRRVQGWVDRRFNRSRYDAERVMDGFASSLRDRVDPGGVVDGWVGVVSETMQPASVGVWVRSHL